MRRTPQGDSLWATWLPAPVLGGGGVHPLPSPGSVRQLPACPAEILGKISVPFSPRSGLHKV